MAYWNCEFVELSKIIGYDLHTYIIDFTLKISLIGYLVIIAIDTQVSLRFVIMMGDATDLIGDTKGPPPKRARPETPNTDPGGGK